jgi:hypothetical protein
VWGWGDVASGDRRGWGLLAVEAIAFVGFWLLVMPYAHGTSSGGVFVLGALLMVAWAAQALHADRTASRRALVFTGATQPSAAVELLWLAPLVVAGATAFWALAGPATSADSLLADYVDAWRSGRAAEAARFFVVPPDPDALAAAWRRQSARLTNEAIRASVSSGGGSGIDPAEPWSAVRWDVPESSAASSSASSASAPGAEPARSVIDAVLVARQTVRDSFFGLVPTTSQRLVPVASLGTVRLRTVQLPGSLPGAPPVVIWRIAEVQFLGDSLGGG